MSRTSARSAIWTVLLLFLAAVLTATTATGDAVVAAPTAETRVKAPPAVSILLVGPTADIAAGQRLDRGPPQLQVAQGRGVHSYYVIPRSPDGATTGPPVLVHNMGGPGIPCGPATTFSTRAEARQALDGELQKAANRFFRGAGDSRSADFKMQGLAGGGYRFSYYDAARSPGYGKLYVQEVGPKGNLIREYKDTLGPNGLIERKFQPRG